MSVGLLVLRITIGGILAGHGTQKLFGWFGGHGREGTGTFFESVGLHPGPHMALLAGASEAGGGLLIALGLLTPLAAAMISGAMLTALWTVHRGSGLWDNNGGFEYHLVLIAALFAITAVGPGNASLDHAIGLDLAGLGWACAELGAAMLGSWTTVVVGHGLAERHQGHPAR
jgi:putative oxidoreductase